MALVPSKILLAILGFAAISQEPAKPSTLAEQLRAIQTDWQAASEAGQEMAVTASAEGKTATEKDEIRRKRLTNPGPWLQRAVDLAEADPKNPASRDALEWVTLTARGYLFEVGSNDPDSPVAKQARAAVEMLLKHHASDGPASHAALNLSNKQNTDHEALVRMFFDRAEGREAKGIATLALAQYLDKKAALVDWARFHPTQPNARRIGGLDEKGQRVTVERTFKPVDDAYYQALRASDRQAIQGEADALFLRVIDEYADVPYERPSRQEADRKAGKPTRTIGQVAEAHFTIAVGQPAPEIAGIDLEGQPLKLADYRGKVVVLSFWGSWCGPCLASIPEERALLEKRKGQPFALLGVDSDETPEVARKAAKDAGMTWPSWFDGPVKGPICRRYIFAGGYPTFIVIDARGIIRLKSPTVAGVDRFLDKILAEDAGTK